MKNKNKGCQLNCGCGCLTLVLESIGFMLICNFCGCEWAKNGTANLVNYIHGLWNKTTTTINH